MDQRKSEHAGALTGRSASASRWQQPITARIRLGVGDDRVGLRCREVPAALGFRLVDERRELRAGFGDTPAR
jgi:hypothetical protein